MSQVAARQFVGARRVDAVAPDHRGIAYGDGLFETMRVHTGQVHWWQRHWTRLQAGARRLAIGCPDADFVQEQVQALAGETGDGVLKLILARGVGGRGYAPVADAEPAWQLTLHPTPPPAAAGLCLLWCKTRLAIQPLLAGMKHCNRLEQVLARMEWSAAPAHGDAADEGLMLDTEGSVVCATAANLFVLREGRWCTPMLDRCGVAGVCRGWAMGALEAVETRLAQADVETADAIFLCNAVRGILPVARVAGRMWAPHPAVAEARRRLAAAHPAWAPADSAAPPSDFLNQDFS